MCRSLQLHHTELTDQPSSPQSWPSGQHVGGTTTQPRPVLTRSPTKLFGKSSRRRSATRCSTPSHRQATRGARTVSAMTQPPPRAPGWYPDPSGAGSRYWDGRNWGPAAPPPAAGGLPKKKQSVPKWVIVVAVIAVLIAIGEAGSHSNNGWRTQQSDRNSHCAR